MKPKPSTRFQTDHLPARMMKERRWVVWKPVERDGKWTKVPVDPVTRENARSNDLDVNVTKEKKQTKSAPGR